ncbi:MAG: phasin family protein [Proteobacteria bacterium]|nr:phasin family protein [Pseudomonadota bacterium]
MSSSMFDQLTNPQKSLLGPWLAFNEMAARLYGEVGKEQVRIVNELMHCQAEQLQQLSQAKKWEQMMEIHAQWLAKAANPLNDYAQHMIDTFLASNADYTKWLEENYLEQAEFIKESIKETKNLQDKALGKK